MLKFDTGRKGKEIHEVLGSLPLFDNVFLSMQASNIAMVDLYLEQLERNLLNEYMENEFTPIPSAMFVGALSQMWVFAFYELLRTWSQQVRELIAYSDALANAIR